MAMRFTVLASGSAGNASLLTANGFGLLIDAGLGPRDLARRLEATGHSWADVHALILTHTHSDHWKDRLLAHAARRGLPLYCHPAHRSTLAAYAPAFAALDQAGLVRPYQAHEPLVLAPGLACLPLPVRHDSSATFGFRFDAAANLFGAGASLGYLADLGCWDDATAGALADVDLLALEFNHEPRLETTSGRPWRLIARVLGDDGHLSNQQAAALVREVLARSAPGRLRHLVQLHLSRDCNRPELARVAAEAVLADAGHAAEVHTAQQDEPLPTLHLDATGAIPPCRRSARRPRSARRTVASHPYLPGFEVA